MPLCKWYRGCWQGGVTECDSISGVLLLQTVHVSLFTVFNSDLLLAFVQLYFILVNSSNFLKCPFTRDT